MSVEHHILGPEGQFISASGEDVTGAVKFIEDHILSLDDHAKYSVATYKASAAIPGKSLLQAQMTAEEWHKQAKEMLRLVGHA